MNRQEAAALSAAKEQMQSYAEALRNRGLTFGNPEIQVWDSSPASYTSELRVQIYRDGVLDDSLEFHVFRNGELLVRTEEVSGWFGEQLRALVK